jgi:hypothetical protein
MSSYSRYGGDDVTLFEVTGGRHGDWKLRWVVSLIACFVNMAGLEEDVNSSISFPLVCIPLYARLSCHI